jgi:hypothetical protein
MNRLLALLAVLGASCALQAAETTSSSSSSASAVATTLEPGKPYESCMSLAPGDKRRWYWKSDGPVDFDIRYADGDNVSYAVKRERMRGDGGTFAPKAAHAYCWTWRAAKPTRLEAKID